MSTEDGRIIFYSTSPSDATLPSESKPTLPQALELGSLSAPDSHTRIKDFTILSLPTEQQTYAELVIIAASSDGAIRVFLLDRAALSLPSSAASTDARQHKSAGRCLGTLETGARITCLAAFVMQPSAARDEDEAIGDAVDGGDSAAGDDSDA